LRGRGWGNPNPRKGQAIWYFILYYNPSTGVGFCKDIHYGHFTGGKGGGRMAERHIRKKGKHQKEKREISVGRKVHS
jgi:hypothetical protein